jgi:hypothetical protein
MLHRPLATLPHPGLRRVPDRLPAGPVVICACTMPRTAASAPSLALDRGPRRLPPALSQAVLEGELAGAGGGVPKDSLAAALARLGRAFMARDS